MSTSSITTHLPIQLLNNQLPNTPSTKYLITSSNTEYISTDSTIIQTCTTIQAFQIKHNNCGIMHHYPGFMHHYSSMHYYSDIMCYHTGMHHYLVIIHHYYITLLYCIFIFVEDICNI